MRREMYKNNGYYYTSIQVNGVRQTTSLRTKSKKEAKAREAKVRNKLYHAIITNSIDSRKTSPGNSALVELFLRTKRKEGISPTTYYTYKYILRPWLKDRELPKNKNTASSYMRTLNAFFNWSNKHYKTDFKLYTNIKNSVRTRVFSNEEMMLLLNGVGDSGVIIDRGTISDFQLFIRFAYYTGCRRGEINQLNENQIVGDKMLVEGKVGERWVKLSHQAMGVLDITDKLWDYKVGWITKTFKRCTYALGISNGVFHDIRRTFGYNLIKNGMPIYKVSKLLGHKSIVTTERHYAPLLATDIEDYEL